MTWHINQSLQRPCKKAAALENISQEMNVAGWYITHHNAALGTKTRLTCFALIGCTLFNWVSCIADRRRQLSCVGEGVCSDATQLDVELSWVELRRYKRALRHALNVDFCIVGWGYSRSVKMTPFDRSYTTSYWSTIASIGLSCTVFELFDVEECHDLEMSLKVTRNNTIR